MFGEFTDNAERGEPPVGDRDGIGDHVKCGIGVGEAAEGVHVREHTAHVMDRHLRNRQGVSEKRKNVVIIFRHTRLAQH